MDVQHKLDEIVAAIENARSMPMSASCVVNRAELVAMLADVREALPAEISHAQAMMADQDQVVAGAQAEAGRIIAEAHAERDALLAQTEIVRGSRAEAERLLAEARAEAEEQRREADDYVDSKLANFEVVLTKTLDAVGRGRRKILGHGPDAAGDYADGPYGDGTAEYGEEFEPSAPGASGSDVDQYVDAKLTTLEAVLSKTLEAVGRGRDKLLGKRSIDELGTYLAAADEAQQQKDRAAAVAAGFAAPDEAARQSPAAGGQGWFRDEAGTTGQPPSYPQQGWDGAAPYAAQADYRTANDAGGAYGGYGHPQQGGYPAQDPYGGQGGYQTQGAGYPAQPGYGPQDAYGAGGTGSFGDPGGYPGASVPHQGESRGPGGLDETSFFDTSVIDVETLRRLGGGR